MRFNLMLGYLNGRYSIVTTIGIVILKFQIQASVQGRADDTGFAFFVCNNDIQLGVVDRVTCKGWHYNCV